MRGAPPTHVVRMRTALAVGPKPPLLSRHWTTAGLAVGLRACVLPTGKFPPLAPLRKRAENTHSEEEESWVPNPRGRKEFEKEDKNEASTTLLLFCSL